MIGEGKSTAGPVDKRVRVPWEKSFSKQKQHTTH